MQEGTIICGFAGIGKTTVAKKYKNVIDLESSDFKWIYENSNLTKEQRKGTEERTPNPGWPENYVINIIQNSNTNNVVLTSLDKEVRDTLIKWGCKYYVAYPEKDCKESYIERYKKRGNNGNFIKTIEDNFDSWIDDLESEQNKIVLHSGEYLEDALISHNLVGDLQ